MINCERRLDDNDAAAAAACHTHARRLPVYLLQPGHRLVPSNVRRSEGSVGNDVRPIAPTAGPVGALLTTMNSSVLTGHSVIAAAAAAAALGTAK